MPRLFVGLEIPSDISFALSLKRGGLPGARWLDKEKYHITLRFIGDVDDRMAYDIVDALEQVDRRPFELTLGNLDMFASRKPHCLWASVLNSMPVMALQADIERAMRRLRLEPESRKFTPHVTIARLKGTTHEEAARYLSERGDYVSRSFRVDRFVLLSSRNSIGGGQYVLEESFDLYADDHAFEPQEDYLSFSRSA
ncbi:MAG: RNA 2',3'-cyclic phosphodiesterase [Pseudomonadota bacterium]